MLQLEKKKEKQNGLKAKVYLIGPFYFATQDTIEGVSVFRIDSRTIKRGNIWLSGYRVPLGEVIIAYALDLKLQ